MGLSDIFGVMDLHRFWVFFFFFSGSWVVCFCNEDAGTGFLSLSCGGTTSYTDSSNISWVSDDSYLTTGINSTVHHIEGTSSTVPIRAFPNPLGRKCYKLPTKNLSSVILVRAQFLYKNYDGLQKPPTFSVSLGTSITSTVNLNTKDPWTEEFVWSVNKDTLLFCLHTIHDGGSPVISSLEIRPLPVRGYRSSIINLSNKVLRKRYRINCGDTNETLRYPFDPYDRIWDKDSNFTPLHLSSVFDSQLDFSFSSVAEDPPVAVLQSARVLARKNVLTYDFPFDTIGDFYIVLYFAGILHAPALFGVIVNGAVMESSYSVNVSETSALYYTRESIKSLNITLTSIKSHPQINAIEVYEIVDVPPEVSSTTVSALEVIQQSAGLDLGWQDDPCSPTTWDHIHCEGNTVTSLELPDINLRSISPTFGDLLDLKNLDLHNTSLSGQIQDLGSLQHLKKLNLSFNQLTSFGPSLENLVSLQILDLQSNSLLGTVPDSLGELKDLHLLNLENNKLQGSLPDSLNRESLELRTSGNLVCLSFSTTTCNDVNHNSSIEAPQVTIVTPKKQTGHSHSHIAIITGSIVGALLVVLSIGISVFLLTRKNISEVTYMSRSVELDMRNWNAAKVFSYREIKSATNHFKVVLGRGSFGSVYLGKLSEGKLVAVKVRFDRSQLGAESFINEVNLLSRIRHQNLVCLEGFCNESKQQILVYEYLPGGSLADHIYGPSSKKKSLSWVRRLKIAVDAAKGLDYLHNGSDPRIIHRDVKCGNILLDTEMNAKVCDFGLSKQVTQADASHVTTVVKGTAGYLDPEYYSTQQLTEKSDIYSFGVVLLELICGREPLRHHGSPDSFNLVLWAKPYLQAGAYEIVVDESIVGSFDVESLRKTASVAVRSVERDAAQRPTIGQVLAELKEAYSLQLSFLASSANGNGNVS